MKIPHYILFLIVVVLLVPAKAANTPAKYSRYICQNDDSVRLFIDKPDPSLTYVWLIDNKQASIVRASGTDSSWVTIIWPSVTSNFEKVRIYAKDKQTGCQSPDTLVKIVEFKSNPNPKIVEPKQVYCINADFDPLKVININFKNPRYVWNNKPSDNAPEYTPKAPGIYSVNVIQTYLLPNNSTLECSGTDDVSIETVYPPKFTLVDTVEICLVSNYTAKPEGVTSKNNKYEWTILSADDKGVKGERNEYNIDANILKNDYKAFLKITDNDTYCESTDSIIIYCKNNDIDIIQISSGFSPNGDEHNATWELDVLDKYPGSTVEVYDRLGNLVFVSDPTGYKPWDGTLEDGTELPMDTYYYILNIVDPNKELKYKNTKYTLPDDVVVPDGNSRSFSKVGTVVILR